MNIKSKLLGEVSFPDPKGKYVVSNDIFSLPLVMQGTVVRAVCLGCGYCPELLKVAAENLAKIAKASVPESWEGYYFEAKKCDICFGDYKDVVLKHV